MNSLQRLAADTALISFGWHKLPSGAQVLLEDGRPTTLRLTRELYSELTVAQARYEIVELTGFTTRAERFWARSETCFEAPLRLITVGR